MLTAEEVRRIDELVHTEVAHVVDALVVQELTFDTLSDAAAVLCRAANRVAPPGHNVHLDRREWYPGDSEGPG